MFPIKRRRVVLAFAQHCNTSGMILADRLASSRLQIELVTVESMRITESSKEPFIYNMSSFRLAPHLEKRAGAVDI
jgi:hypothetical protein